MKESLKSLRGLLASIIQSPATDGEKLERINILLSTFKPLDHAEVMGLVCDVGIALANQSTRTEMIAQLFHIKAKAEVLKASFPIHESKNLKLALGWFGFALESEKDRFNQLESLTKEVWVNTQKYIDYGFNYLKMKPYITAVGYCQRTVGDVLSTIYLQKVGYYFQPVGSWTARIAQFKLVRFLNLDVPLLIDKQSRKELKRIKKDALRCFDEAIKAFKQENAWEFLAESYIGLGLEHHSFNSPIRSKLALYRAQRLIKKHAIHGLDDRLRSIQDMPLIGSDRDESI